MTDMTKIPQSELQTVLPVYNGLPKLKEAIDSRTEVFCTCSIAKKYQVGAFDALETLKRASGGDSRQAVLMPQNPDAEPSDDTIFSPIKPTGSLKENLEEEILFVSNEVKRVYRGLQDVNENYKVGLPLFNQPSEFRENFLKAFIKLRLANFLPETVGNSAYSHQGMYLLMEGCFRNHQTFIKYLKNPDLLDLEETTIDQASITSSLERGRDELLLANALRKDDWLGMGILTFLRDNENASFATIREGLNLSKSRPEELLTVLADLHKANAVEIKPDGITLSVKGKRLFEKIEDIIKTTASSPKTN